MRIVIFLLLTSIFLGCGGNQQSTKIKKPNNFLKKEKFTALLVDIQLVEAAKTKNYLSSKDSSLAIKEAYATVFKKHNISQKDFEENLAYHYDYTGNMEEIFGDVLNELIKKEADLKGTKEAENN